MIVFILLVLVLVLLLALSRIHTSPTFDDPPAPPRPRQDGSRTHFIDAHLHRDDAKKARHKQNQFPF